MAVEVLITNDGKLDCHTCDDKLKEERGHDRNGIIPFWVGEERVYRCPLTLITPLSYEYIKAFSFFDRGFLPNGKSWQSESNKLLQALQILENEFSKFHKKDMKKVNRNGR